MRPKFIGVGPRALGLIVALLAPAAAALCGEGPGPQAEGGEEQLAPQAAAEALAGITAGFKGQPCVRAAVVKRVDDPLFGPTEERGRLLLKRPDRLLLRYEGKRGPAKIWRLVGDRLQEYNATTRKVYERDFSQAPKALAVVRAAMTLDALVLGKYCDVTVFRRGRSGDTPAQYRVVFTRKEEVKGALDYQRIEARIFEGAAFYHQIEKVLPAGQGDPAIESYSQVRVEQDIGAGEFAEPLIEKAERSVEAVREIE